MESKTEKNIFSGVIYLAVVSGVLITACINHLALSDVLIRAGYSLAISGVYFMALYYGDKPAIAQITDKLLYFFTLIVAFCLVGVSATYSTGAFWLLPLVVVARYPDIMLRIATYGILMMYYFCNALTIHGQLGQMEYYLVMGLAVMLIFSILKKGQELPYASVILLALCVALQVLGSGFHLERLMEQKYQILLEIFSVIFLVLFGSILFLRSQMGRELPDQNQETDRILEERLAGFLQDDFVLMERLKEKEELYEHSCEISRLSGAVAGEMGFDSLLASAGGMYHEIGRIEPNGNALETSIQLAEEYHFPERMIEIIRQHSTKSENPKSPEAAIVMLSDYIITTGEYLEKNNKRDAISNEKLVNSIFKNRMEKGNLEEAGLSEEQLSQLQECFILHI